MINLHDIRLRPKLTGLLLLCGLIPVLLAWWFRDHQADQSTRQQAESRLEAARQVALTGMKRHMAERRADMELLSQGIAEHYQQAKSSLEAWRNLKKEHLESLLNGQLHDTGQLAAHPDFAKRVAAIDWLFRQGGRKPDDKHWRETVEGYQPPIHGRPSVSVLEEIFFISTTGDVVYSMTRQAELGQNIHQKPLKDTPLARTHRLALESATIQDVPAQQMADTHGALLLGAPVKKDGTTIGTVITRISRTLLTRLARAGLDPAIHGEPILMAEDGPRLDPIPNRASPGLSQALIRTTLDGHSGAGLHIGTGSPPVLAAWTPIQVKGLRWALVMTREASRIFAPHPGESHNWLQKFSETAGYYDLFLIHPDGHAFYTTARQADSATNLLTGRYASTNLGQLIQKVIKTRQAGLSDLVPYPPSDNQPAFFMAQPVIENEQVILVAALQLAPDTITAMLHQFSHACGCRILLVGSDARLRSDAFTDPSKPATATAFIGGQAAAVVSQDSIQSALSGETATRIGTRADGSRALSSFAPLPMDAGFSWAVIAENELETITAEPHSLATLIGMLACVLLLTWGAMTLIQRDLLNPLDGVSFLLNRMASGHFKTPAAAARHDEIGTLTRSIATVAEEVSQAGQRIHAAADPLALRIRRLASQAMLVNRESAAGMEILAEARNAVMTFSNRFDEHYLRLIQDRERLIQEQTRLLGDAEQLADLTARAVSEGKQMAQASSAVWHQLLTRLDRFQEHTEFLSRQTNPITPAGKSGEDGGKSGKQAKHNHHGKDGPTSPWPLTRTTRDMQLEIATLKQLITERLQADTNAHATLDALLPAMPLLQTPEAQTVMTLEHTPEQTLIALDRLDELLKKNATTARELILSAKSIFDITTGPLKQSASYFTPHDATDKSTLGSTGITTLDASGHPGVVAHAQSANSPTTATQTPPAKPPSPASTV